MGVLVGRTLVDLQKQLVPVRLLNTDSRGRKLKKGAVIAQCQELGSVLRPLGKEDSTEVPTHLLPLYEKIISELHKEEATQVREVLIEYADVFSKGPDDLGRTGLVKHHICTTDAPPIRQRPRRLPHVLREEADQAVDQMKHDRAVM